MMRRSRQIVNAQLAKTALPDEVRAFIGSLVGRTRLRGAEQREIAAELASHFSEGLAAGKSATELLAAYGDERESAREMRAAAIAKRSALDRAAGALVKWGGIGAAAVFAAYLGSAGALYFREPVISFDARAAMNARLPKAGPEGRALEIYAAALGEWGRRNRGDWVVPGIDAPTEALERIDADAAAVARVREFVDEWRGVIDALREVRARPVFGLAVVTTSVDDETSIGLFGKDALVLEADAEREILAGAIVSVLLPQASMLRSCARLLVLDAALAAYEGRGEVALASFEAAMTAGVHAGEPGFLICRLVESGIKSLVIESIGDAVARHPSAFNDAQLAQLERLVRTQRIDLVVAFESEWSMMRDLVQRCYSDDGGGDGVLLPRAHGQMIHGLTSWSSTGGGSANRGRATEAVEFMVGPVLATIAPSRREVEDRARAYYTKAIAVTSAESEEERAALRSEFDGLSAQLGRNPRSIFEYLAPGLDRAFDQPRKLEELAEKTADAIAAERATRAAIGG